MSTATILLTGPRLPYHVIDYAINWAKDHEASLRALFLVPGRMPEEGYPFPNDLDDAERLNTGPEAERGITGIVQDEIRFVEKRCGASHVPVTSELVFSPSVKKVMSKLNDSELIFIDKNAELNEDDLSNLSFSIDDLTAKSEGHFISVGEMDSYTDPVY